MSPNAPVLHIVAIFIHVHINIDKYNSIYILIFQHCIKNKINKTYKIQSYSKYDLRNAILEIQIVLTGEKSHDNNH